MSRSGLVLLVLLLLTGCQPEEPSSESEPSLSADALAATYATVRLDPPIGELSESQRKMIPELVGAAQSIDAVFWEQAYGNRDSLLQSIQDPVRRRYAKRNYGPWDRLRNDTAFVNSAGPRPPGANFYPAGVTANILRQAQASSPGVTAPETMVRRLPDGSLTALPYHLFFSELMTSAAYHLRDAASLSTSTDFRRYLEQRASSLVGTDSAATADADPEMPPVHVLIGALPTGEDHLLGVKASATALVLRQNEEQTRRFRSTLQALSASQLQGIVPDSLIPNPPADMVRAYDALYVSGGLNTGTKDVVHSIPSALLPHEGDDRLFLFPNIAKAKVDSILTPVGRELLQPRQREHVSTAAFLDFSLLSNVARSGSSDASTALAGLANDAIGLSLAMSLPNRSTADPDSLDYAVTGLANLFHAVHVDSSTAAGQATMAALAGLMDRNAISHNQETDLFAVNPPEMARALPEIVRELNRAPDAFVERNTPSASLRSAVSRLDATSIPKAIAFRQGLRVLGIEAEPMASR